jgi:hypothetical protein
MLMDLEKVFVFLEKNKLTFEEMGMLLTIYYRNTDEKINKQANIYYEKGDFQSYIINGVVHSIQWKDIIDKLIKLDLVDDLRNLKEKQEKAIKLSKLKVTKSFIDMYFVNQDTAYEFALKLYPDFLSPDTKTGVKHQSKTVNHIHYKSIFYNKVLKGGSKEEFDFFVYMTKEKFNYCPTFDHDYNEIGGEPEYYAITKWDKYLDDYDSLKKDFMKTQTDNTSW